MFKSRKQPKAPIYLLEGSDAITLISNMLNAFGPRGCTHVIIALSVSDISYHSFPRAVIADGRQNEYSPDLNGFSKFCWEAYQRTHSMEGSEYEMNSRRCAYLFIAVQLRRVRIEATSNSSLWDKIAPLWTRLLEGAQLLPEVVMHSNLWKDQEIEEFKELTSPEEALFHVEACYLPKEIQFHHIINHWRDRDLSPEERAEFEELKKLME
jgi:hypothetical protein